MGYDHGDRFPFDFRPNGIPFGSKLKGKLSPRSYPIQYERKWKHSFLSVPVCLMGESAALCSVLMFLWKVLFFSYRNCLCQLFFKLVFCC